MKIKKIRYLSLLVICGLCAIGVAGYEFLTTSRNHKEELHTNIQVGNIDKIAGLWVREDSGELKFLFGPGTQVKMYKVGEPVIKGIFEITDSCNGETYKDSMGNPGAYLKINVPEIKGNFCQKLHELKEDRMVLTLAGEKKARVYIRR